MQFKIGQEVRQKLRSSIITILFLSDDYFKSAYCINESGVAWFLDDDAIIITVFLPGFSMGKFLGFRNEDWKPRRLNNHSDLSSIYDNIQEILGLEPVKHEVVDREIHRLISRYNDLLEKQQK